MLSALVTDVAPLLRLLVWTPLPPQRSGIADHNMKLLPELGRLADVGVVVDGDLVGEVEIPANVNVLTRAEAEAHRRTSTNVLSIYHMGNHCGFHRWIHDELLHEPGLVVLHDPSLADFYGTYHEHRPHDYTAEIRLNYGTIGQPPGRQVGAIWHLDRLALQLVRRVVDASLGVVAHSPWAREELARRFPHKPTFHVELAAPVAGREASPADMRHRLGWRADDVVFGMLGSLRPHKRPDLIVQVFAAVHRLRPNARLLIAGRLEDTEGTQRLRALISAAGLDQVAKLLTDVDDAEFSACVGACDALVDLRWPTAGEIPATLMQAFGAGRPAIVSDLPQLRDFDARFCWRVPVEPASAVRTALETMLLIARDPSLARAAGWAAREFVETTATAEHCARRYRDIALEVLARTGGRTRPRPSRERYDGTRTGLDVNVIGDFEATTGLMEAGRRAVHALVASGVDVQLTAFDCQALRSATRRIPELNLPWGRAGGIDLWLVNVNEFHLVGADDLRPPNRPTYSIAYWYWEASTLPPFASAQLSRVDEVWVASHFVAATFRRMCSKPVRVMPCVVDVPLPPTSSRADFGLPDDALLILYSFDANSSDARKNPWGLIEAFARAFDARERSGPVRLVMKVQNLATQRFRSALEEALAGVGGILIEGELSREEMNGLLGVIDVYASLHRAEGFGLGLAEAMFLGKPVIATAYSGNVDFMNAANSCRVGYSLRPITEADHRWVPEVANVYQPGLIWAEPRLDHAVRWMRLLYERPEERERIGAAAASTIRDRFGLDAVGAVMVDRLREIRRGLPLIAGGPAA